jgi:DNA replication and repair protein RecF
VHIASIYLHHFRNYDEATFEFSPRLNLVCGPNALGKTSLLEAIYFLMTGRSFRTSSPIDMIKQGTPSLYVEISFLKHEIEQRLKLFCDGKERKILYNSTAFSSSASLLGILKGVVITPDDVALVKAAPQARRTFMDLQIAQVDPLYIHHLTRYHRAMRQRNHLLRTKQLITIESWEREMAVSAAYLTQQRSQAMSDLKELVHRIHAELTDQKEHLSIEYKGGIASEAPLEQLDVTQLELRHLAQWEKQRQREVFIGYTLYGPHKDDLILTINEKDVRSHASEGQQRCCVTALRLAEWARLRQLADEPPLLLVDDMGISLDNRRRQRLLEHMIAQPGQIFLSTTDESLLDGQSDEKQVITLKV